MSKKALIVWLCAVLQILLLIRLEHLLRLKTESGFNPYAIGVGGSKGLQPKNLQEAVFYVSKLVAKKRSFSVGLGQVNQVNFSSLGLTAKSCLIRVLTLKSQQRF